MKENEDDWWVMPLIGLVAVFGLIKFWQITARPWLEVKWAALTAGEAVLNVPGLGPLDRTDLVGIALAAVLVVGVVGTITRRRSARRAEQDEQHEEPAAAGKAKSKRSWW